MKTNLMPLATVALCTAALTCLPRTQAQGLYSQTLNPGVTISSTTPALGTNQFTIEFTGTLPPAGDGTFTLTATGDLNGGADDQEFVTVLGEDGALLGTLFDGVNETSPVTETGSLAIPLALLSNFAADGAVRITISVVGLGVAGVTIDEATLTYPTAALVPCAGPAPGRAWKNHGAYVSAVTQAALALVEQGLISEEDAGAQIVAAARSDCGRR